MGEVLRRGEVSRAVFSVDANKSSRAAEPLDRKAKLNKMITPTDEQLNRAAAELCGYSIYYAEAWATVPNFCTNRNALPELWNVIEANGTSEVFLNSLWHQMQTLHTDYDRFSQWYLATAPPKMHVIAALISCMAWLADWEL